jgi:hypothetical protein
MVIFSEDIFRLSVIFFRSVVLFYTRLFSY